MYGVITLTVEEVAAESRGKMPPQAMMRLSTTWEMRWILLWTNTTFSLLFTKSKIVFVEWLKSWKNTALLRLPAVSTPRQVSSVGNFKKYYDAKLML